MQSGGRRDPFQRPPRGRIPATAKLNLALVVGPRRPDGRHDVCTVLQRVDFADRIALAASPSLRVSGFAEDTLVREALSRLAERAGVEPRWSARITKRIPPAAGLGGGSSDAAAALRLANATLKDPLDANALLDIAAGLGADVPFFLTQGPQLGEGDGTDLSALDLPQDYWVVLVLPAGAAKPSTASVYDAFDRRGGERGFEDRRRGLLDALARVRRPADLAALPPNDLSASPLAAELRRLGAFRSDVTGAGPAVYGLFRRRQDAVAARRALEPLGRTWVTAPAWYG
jgi:4-diphosphocytidyl-2-C-methyl-D-erythritol kinase